MITKLIKRSILILFFLNLSAGMIIAQSRLVLQPGSTVTVSGTSNVHDWEMTTTNPTSFAEFKVLTDGKPEVLQALNFRLQKSTLKSDKSGLEKRALEALKADKNPEISFQSSSPAQVKQNGDKMIITTQGRLSIAGVTKVVDVSAECTNGNGDTLVCKGEKKLKMTDFNVTPPTMMLGALKVTDDITISYTMIYK
jgi:polyisoprenoid-binding protein YceI